jgi:catechol 2,3-dioxygenase
MSSDSTLDKHVGSFTVRLDHIALHVADLQKSIKYYEHVLGMKVISQCTDEYAQLSFGGSRRVISLYALGSTCLTSGIFNVVSKSGFHFAFEVANVRLFCGVYKRVQEHGLEIMALDHHTSWAIYFRDPDDNSIEIFLTRDVVEGTNEAVWSGETRFLAEFVIEEELLRYNQVNQDSSDS